MFIKTVFIGNIDIGKYNIALQLWKSESVNKKMTDNTGVKMTNNDLQKTTQKAKDRAKRTPLTAADELRRLGRVSSSYSIIRKAIGIY
jgi:hypothetical protein